MGEYNSRVLDTSQRTNQQTKRGYVSEISIDDGIMRATVPSGHRDKNKMIEVFQPAGTFSHPAPSDQTEALVNAIGGNSSKRYAQISGDRKKKYKPKRGEGGFQSPDNPNSRYSANADGEHEIHAEHVANNGKLTNEGDAHFKGNVVIDGDLLIKSNLTVTGNLTVEGSTTLTDPITHSGRIQSAN